MKRFIIAAIALIGLSFTANAQRFAYVDSDYILAKVPAYEQAQNQLDQLAAQWQLEIENLYTDIDALYKAYNAEKVLLTDEMRKEREDVIIAKEKEAKELQRKYFGPQGELFQKRQELIKPIQDQIFNAISEVAKKRKYDMVFDKASGTAVLYTSTKLDVSDQVLEEMGYRY